MTKNLNIYQNLNVGQKSNYLPKIEILVKKLQKKLLKNSKKCYKIPKKCYKISKKNC